MRIGRLSSADNPKIEKILQTPKLKKLRIFLFAIYLWFMMWKLIVAPKIPSEVIFNCSRSTMLDIQSLRQIKISFTRCCQQKSAWISCVASALRCVHTITSSHRKPRSRTPILNPPRTYAWLGLAQTWKGALPRRAAKAQRVARRLQFAKLQNYWWDVLWWRNVAGVVILHIGGAPIVMANACVFNPADNLQQYLRHSYQFQ